jgi:hypothetical protein
MSSYGNPERLPDYPNLLIGSSVAEQVLSLAGLDLKDLKERAEAGEKMALETGIRVRVGGGLAYEEAPAANVVGYIAGIDTERRGERILVAAPYGQGHGGADENASGIAAMLEMARALQEMEFIPKRTIAFAAFDDGGGQQFVIHPSLPTGRSDLWTVVNVNGIAAGDARLARAESGSGLARAFDQSARRMGVRTERLDEARFFFVTNSSRLSFGEAEPHKSYQAVAVTRPGDERSGTPDDTPERLDPDMLVDAARAIMHFVMVVSFR